MQSGRFISLFAAYIAIIFAGTANAQDFREREDHWKTQTIRARCMDTVRLEQHSFFALPKISDTTALVYHEPMPDSLMPKTAIEVGKITVQASSAEDVLAMLEKEARAVGADWIVSFNEPRLKLTAKGEGYYRSQALLYKVINSELVSEQDITEVNCSECHLDSFASIE